MTKQIHIGDVSIPLDSYAIGGTALLGIRASGKSYAAKGIAEQLLEHRVPIIVFDPIGVWRHLKVPALKNGKGYPVVVAGGRGADLQLTPQSATEIVRAAMRENIPLVVDLYDKTMSKSDWRRIVQTCFRTLLYENEGMRHIFLEEAAEYCPQKVQDGETYAEVEKLVRMGGNASLGITLINQRAQEVNKAVLDLCENLVLMRQMGAHAIGALEKWIDKVSPDFAGKIAASMPKMHAGQAWVFAGGAEKPVFTRTATIRTFHPDRKNPDAKASTTATDTSSFVAAMQRALPAIVEQQQANDPKKLKARIAELDKKLGGLPVHRDSDDALVASQQKEIERLRVDNAAYRKAAETAAGAWKQVDERLRKIQAIADIYSEPPPAIPEPSAPAHTARPSSIPRVAAPAPRSARSNDGERDPRIGRSGKARIMITLAQNHGRMTQRRLSLLSGLSARSGTWSTYLSELRTAGFIEGSDDIRPTAAGIAAIGDYEPLPTGDELIAYWQNRLGNSGKRAIFDALVAAYPQALQTDEAAEAAGLSPKSGTWSTYLSELRGLELISGRGELKASEELFG